MRRALVALFALFVAAGCSRKPDASAAAAKQAGQANQAGPTLAAAQVPQVAHGTRKKAGIDVPVYVDGKQIATLRYGELPATLIARTSPEREHTDARYYNFVDYLKTLGVAVDRVQGVHLRGNANRFASVDGDELVRERSRLVFDFQEKETGIARMRWDTTGLRNLFRIEEIRAVFVFVDKPVPAFAPGRNCYVDPSDNSCSDKVPYEEDEVAKGTRIYVDGKLVGAVKRRRLTDDLVVGKNESGLHRFALTRLLAKVGVDLAGVASVELLSGDELVGRGAGADLARREGEATFVIPPHQSGRVRLEVPRAWQASSDDAISDAEVTAVLVHKSIVPKQPRPLTPLSDLPSEEPVLAGGG